MILPNSPQRICLSAFTMGLEPPDGGVSQCGGAEGHGLLVQADLGVVQGMGVALLAVSGGEVTSPAGTTSRGLELLAERAFHAAAMQAVRAAAARSRELGK